MGYGLGALLYWKKNKNYCNPLITSNKKKIHLFNQNPNKMH